MTPFAEECVFADRPRWSKTPIGQPSQAGRFYYAGHFRKPSPYLSSLLSIMERLCTVARLARKTQSDAVSSGCSHRCIFTSPVTIRTRSLAVRREPASCAAQVQGHGFTIFVAPKGLLATVTQDSSDVGRNFGLLPRLKSECRSKVSAMNSSETSTDHKTIRKRDDYP